MSSITFSLSGGSTFTIELSSTATPTETRDAIQSALDSVAANPGGGTVTLSSGTFILAPGATASDGALRVGSNTTFEGAGAGLTTLKLADAPGHDVTGIVRLDSGTLNPADGTISSVHDVTIAGMTIDGNSANTGTALVDGFYSGPRPGTQSALDSNITLTRVEVTSCSRYGFDPHEGTKNLTLGNCVAHDNAVDGFVVDGSTNVTVTNCISYDNGRNGFNIVTGSSNVTMTGNVSHDNGAAGIVVQTGDNEARTWTHDVTITGGEIYRNGTDGIGVRQASGVTIGGPAPGDGVLIHDNARYGALVEGARGVLIEGNTIYGNNPGSSGTDDSEVRVRGYLQTYGDGDSANDAFIQSSGLSIVGNAIGTPAGTTQSHGITVQDLADPMIVSGNTFTHVAAGHEITTLASTVAPAPLYNYVITDGDDTITGTAGADTIAAGSGNDHVSGGAGNDTLYGNDGNDTLDGGTGADKLIGGQGDDTYYVDNAGDTVTESSGQGHDTVYASVSYTLSSNVEDLVLVGDGLTGTGSNIANTIIGTAGADTLSGLAGNDTLIGGEGDDALYGGTGNDTLEGGAGDDILDGGAHGDVMRGGAGNDTYYVDSTADDVQETAGNGIDRVFSSVTYSLATRPDVEQLTLTGTAAINATGGAFANVLVGNSAANVMTGGGGADILTGGEGADRFDYNDVSESGMGTGARDVITDFQHLVDVIDLATIDANKLVSGNQAFTWKDTAALTGAGQVHVVYTATGAIIEGDVDGGGADFQIELVGVGLVSIADLIR